MASMSRFRIQYFYILLIFIICGCERMSGPSELGRYYGKEISIAFPVELKETHCLWGVYFGGQILGLANSDSTVIVAVSVKKLNSRLSYEKFIQKQIEFYQAVSNQLYPERFAEGSTQTSTGLPMRWITWVGSSGEGRSMDYYLNDKNKIYQLSFFVREDKLSEYKDKLDEAAKSIKFEK